ncbi:Protein YIF1 [Caenorhabditis elegans]|uniref:Protein YIF1 n=1 Tax=Caenorhabditis elegans TaxID=6239 RepID=Q2PJ77_CAEEL|nr:Protein YIF1 [Caenorhabditis elegans]CAJ55254.1 Protein YIF1 [Caenorhabditis elegans]|eukprot:NP_001041127.1 YIP1-Interacting Factor homolog [Caenorhabditis elegans]
MSNEWGNDWNTDSWNTGYSQPQQPSAPPAAPAAAPQDQSYGGGYYSQQSSNQGFDGYGQQSPTQNQYGGYGQQQQQQQSYGQNNGFGGFQPQQLMSDPMLNAAKQFGGQFAEQQKEKLTKYLGTFNLKYYFAVDNAYVGKKLGILFFPFFHKDWSLKFAGSADPAPAREDVNAPDLYIPLMSFLTYILVSGFVLGTQGRFSPEILGILTSNALIWVILENIVIFISKYILNISQSLSVWHSLAYSTYKFAHMIVCLLLFMVGDKTFYYGALAYSSLALVIFLLRSVSHFMFDSSGSYGSEEGRKRKLILVAFVVITQPLIMWWLTSVASNYDYDKFGLAQMALSKMTGGSGSKAKQFMTNDGDIDYEALLKMPKDDFEGM